MGHKIPFIRRQIITEIIVGAYVLLFVYAGLSKLFNFKVFAERIESSLHTTPINGKIIGIVLIAAEIITSILFFSSRQRLRALYSSLILMIVFTVYIICLLLFSPYVPCSCGGILQNMSWGTHVVFNMVFIVLAIIAIVNERRHSYFQIS